MGFDLVRKQVIGSVINPVADIKQAAEEKVSEGREEKSQREVCEQGALQRADGAPPAARSKEPDLSASTLPCSLQHDLTTVFCLCFFKEEKKTFKKNCVHSLCILSQLK